MIDKIKPIAEKAQAHVIRNRAKYASATTAAACLAAHMRIVGNFNTFLEGHDLIDEFYKVVE